MTRERCVDALRAASSREADDEADAYYAALSLHRALATRANRDDDEAMARCVATCEESGREVRATPRRARRRDAAGDGGAGGVDGGARERTGGGGGDAERAATSARACSAPPSRGG